MIWNVQNPRFLSMFLNSWQGCWQWNIAVPTVLITNLQGIKQGIPQVMSQMNEDISYVRTT